MKKKFDSVQLMREIRNKLGKEYTKNPKLRNKRLEIVHKKYGLTAQKKTHSFQ